MLKQVSATGDVDTGRRTLMGVTLTPAAAVATLEVRDGSGGAVQLKLQAAANGNSAIWRSGSDLASGAPSFSTSIHATLSGAGAVASFEYS